MSAWLKELERLYAPHPVPGALRAYLSASAHTNPSMSQAGFRIRNDDGSETTATWTALENTNATLGVDVNKRIRFVVDETAGGAENIQCKLQYNLNAAGWNDVNATSLVVRSAASANFAEGDATTRQLTSGTGTFLAGKMDEVDGATNANVVFAGGELTEFEFCFQIRSADVANNDSLQLRLVRSAGTVLEAYAQTPTITVSEAGGTTFFQTLPATAVGVASVNRVTTFFRALAATAVGVAVLNRITTFVRTLAAIAVGVASLTSASVIGKTLSATAVGVATLSTALLTSVTMTATATAVGVATLNAAQLILQTLSATAVGVASLTAQFIEYAGGAAGDILDGVKRAFRMLMLRKRK